MKLNHPAFALICIPWLLAMIFSDFPILSFLTAWSGSFYIFYITLFSRCSVYSVFSHDKIAYMQPIFMIQLIFAGFMCCTSIFYFIAHLDGDLLVIANCQRISLLGHISLVSGIMITLNENKSSTTLYPKKFLWTLSKVCVVSLAVALSLDYIPGLIQLKYPLLVLSATCGSYLLIHGIYQRSFLFALFGTTIYITNFINSTLSGFKEGIIVQWLTIIFIALPIYKKSIIALGLPIACLFLYILPTYTIVIREQSWFKGKPRENAREQAYQTFFDDGNDEIIDQNNWKFLTNRFSEIGMFSKYVSQVPDSHDFYGLEIFYNTCIALIPKMFWDEKPSMEALSMKRVYEAGVAKKTSPISAKTRPVVDGYLIYGNVGVFITMILYGMLTQRICNKAENLFGGYEMGCSIIFNSLFQQLWRGNNLEFLINNIVYAYLLMLLIYNIMKYTNCLNPIYDHSHYTGL
ncbi:exosortase Y-associated Wzy-like protein [Pedobacter sp. PWIIR3]